MYSRISPKSSDRAFDASLGSSVFEFRRVNLNLYNSRQTVQILIRLVCEQSYSDLHRLRRTDYRKRYGKYTMTTEIMK